MVGLVLALLGMASVLGYAVSRRLREIGIRMAVGASGREVLRLIVGRGLALGMAGVAVGLVGAVWGARVLQGIVPGVEIDAPGIFAAVALLLLLATAGAAWIPARRAARLDPLMVLREQ